MPESFSFRDVIVAIVAQYLNVIALSLHLAKLLVCFRLCHKLSIDGTIDFLPGIQIPQVLAFCL